MKWELLATPHSQEGHPERAGLHVCRPFPVGFFKDADSHVAPPSDLGTAIGAGDNALIGRMGRDGESIAATLAAPERESVRVVHSGQSNYNRRGVAERGKSILKTACQATSFAVVA